MPKTIYTTIARAESAETLEQAAAAAAAVSASEGIWNVAEPSGGWEVAQATEEHVDSRSLDSGEGVVDKLRRICMALLRK